MFLNSDAMPMVTHSAKEHVKHKKRDIFLLDLFHCTALSCNQPNIRPLFVSTGVEYLSLFLIFMLFVKSRSAICEIFFLGYSGCAGGKCNVCVCVCVCVS